MQRGGREGGVRDDKRAPPPYQAPSRETCVAEAASSGDRLFRSIVAAKPKLVTGVPDGMLSRTIMLCEASPDFPYIACAREEECIGVASGAAMAGERAIVMVQNAGLLNSLGAFATMGLRYGLPFVVIVTNRGALADPNGYDIEKREAFDAGVRPMARVFDTPTSALDTPSRSRRPLPAAAWETNVTLPAPSDFPNAPNMGR